MEIQSKRAERRMRAREEKVISEPSENPVKSASTIGDFFELHYKKLMIIPILLIILAIAQVGFQIASTGDFVQKGISLSGGTSITIQKEIDVSVNELEQLLKTQFPGEDVRIRGLTSDGIVSGAIIESTVTSEEERTILIKTLQEKIPDLTKEEYTQEVIGASLGDQFFKQTITTLIVAFILMSLVVFFYFREFGPSIFIVVSMIADIIVTLAIVNLLGIQLSTSGVAAFLMLIGYAVDSNIVLSTKMLKEKGTRIENFLSGSKTGITMTVTTISAVAITYFLTSSEVIQQIMLIIFCGLLIDAINTWILNGGLIRMYLDRKDHGKA